MAFEFNCYNITWFLCRTGFSAEQLARWVAERTDVNVGGLFYVFNLEEINYRCSFLILSFIIILEPGAIISITLKTQTAKDIFLLTEK